MSSSPAQKVLLFTGAAFYLGLAVGLPLALQSSRYGSAPNTSLFAAGVGLVLIAALLVPVVIISRTAKRLGSARWLYWLYLLISLVFWPVGSMFVLFRLWDRCSDEAPAP